jgi:hypothetical protein
LSDAVMMIPALDHGSRPGVQPAVGSAAAPPLAEPEFRPVRPVREVTRTVMAPSAARAAA